VRLKLAAGVVAVAVLGVCAAAAWAGGTIKSTVKITKATPTVIKGKVTSERARCKENRGISLYYSDSRPAFSGHEITGGVTNSKGIWKTTGHFDDGYYGVFLHPEKVPPAPNVDTCSGALEKFQLQASSPSP
jgi:hypothetical protein